MNNNLTELQIPFLQQDFNFTDGHMYRTWTSKEEEIINNSVNLLKQSNRQMQRELEKEYIYQFLTLGKQTVDFTHHNYLLSTSASLGFEIVANYLRMKNMSVCLVEPCFDNLADIFKRHDIPLESFSDEYFDKPEFLSRINNIQSDAVCFVVPNNPTGKTLSKENFLALIACCKKNNKLLILDCCFRAYLPSTHILDHYGILKDSGIKYIIIEDTGKTWPTVELKAPFLCVSNSLYQPIYDIYTDLILHISPFVISLMTKFIKLTIKEDRKNIVDIAQRNRKYVYKAIQGTILTPVEEPYISVCWLKVAGMTGLQVKSILDKHHIHILPGDKFYWSNPKKGRQFVRISLARDTKIVKEGMRLLRDVLFK